MLLLGLEKGIATCNTKLSDYLLDMVHSSNLRSPEIEVIEPVNFPK